MLTKKPLYLSPLASWDIYSEHYDKLVQKTKVDFDLEELKLALKGHLEMSVVDKIVEEDYDALIVTDLYQKIEWVSRGFSEMNGYPKSFALGKNPRFLQGPDTSANTKQSIRERLAMQESFTDSILNYRKNGESYWCQIKIIPLFNKQNKLSNYLAVERELKVA